MYEMGFIGTGNMGGALARAAAKNVTPAQIVLYNRTAAKAAALAEELRCLVADGSADIAARCRFILLGVKPQMMGELLAELAPVLKARTTPFVLVTMAAGISADKIQELADGDYPVIRIMPNTPCAIGEGVILCCRSENVTDEDYADFKAAFRAGGTLVDLSEHLIDAGCAISGCGPAFVYTFIEAMADAGVACGLTRADALSLAAATAAGSAKMVMESGEHPAALRDKVCSPGGSTIAGVLALEQDGFRAAVEHCIAASFERTKELGK